MHYFCLLPDMYYRIGTLRFDFVRRAEGMRPTMFAAMNSLTNALVTEDTAAWLGFLDAQDKVRPGGIGCIGYCMSGRYVTTVAARFRNRFAASASLYGVGIVTNAEDSPHLLIDRIKGEMYFGFAETDEHVPANVIPTLKSGLDKAGTRYGLDVFPNSRHGFQFPERDVYETHAAELEQGRRHVGPQSKNSGCWTYDGIVEMRRLKQLPSAATLVRPSRCRI